MSDKHEMLEKLGLPSHLVSSDLGEKEMKTEERMPKVGEWIILHEIWQEKIRKGTARLDHITPYFRAGGITQVKSVIQYNTPNNLFELIVEPIVIDKNKYVGINLFLTDGYIIPSTKTKEPFISVLTEKIDEVICAEYDDEIYCKCFEPQVITNCVDFKWFKMCKKCGKEMM